MTADDAILVESDGASVVVRINRPSRRNALREQDARHLADVLRGIDATGTARVVVLGGVGGWLCAGGDLADGVADGQVSSDRMVGQFQALLRTVLELSVPVVVVLEGAAVGAGAAFALAADVCIAHPDARIVLPWVARGLVPDMGVAFLLARQLGAAKTKRLLYGSSTLAAADAVDCGLITATAEEPWAAASAEAATLANGPRFALASTKRLVNAAAFGSFDAYLAVERASMAAALGTPEPAEGIAAFLERRAPVFE
jgi:2-(1,2-epoxy-1,2-dihydrophenyl)acetyl-CoA isomerase